MGRTVSLALLLGLSGCALPAPPPSPVPPEVHPAAAVARPSAALLDPFVGRFTSAGISVTISRVGAALVASQAGLPPRPLTLVGNATFADALGNSHIFASSGRRLTVIGTDGRRREWVRTTGE